MDRLSGELDRANAKIGILEAYATTAQRLDAKTAFSEHATILQSTIPNGRSWGLQEQRVPLAEEVAQALDEAVMGAAAVGVGILGVEVVAVVADAQVPASVPHRMAV